MYSILNNAQQLIKKKFGLNECEPNKDEIRVNKVRRNKWGFPVIDGIRMPRTTKKIR